MPFDASANAAEVQRTHKRGPLRPSRLTTARSRVGGDVLMRLVQLTDLSLMAGALVSGWIGGRPHRALLLMLASSGLVAATMFCFEVYRFVVREKLYRHLYWVIGAVGGSGLIMLSLTSFMAPRDKAADVLHLVNWCVSMAALLCASHAIWFGFFRRQRRLGLLTPNLMIVGATPAAERLIHAALAHREVNILGVFDDRGGERRPRNLFDVPLLGKTVDVKSHRLLPYVDRIVVAVPAGATARIANLLTELAPIPNTVSLLVDSQDPAAEYAALDRILQVSLSDIAGVRRGAFQSAMKRTLDLTFSLIGVLVLAPAFAAIAVAIRLDSPGAVLFKQKRHGYMNEEVLVWKFRSMRVEMADYAASRQVTADDERVTRVGRFLRRTSLDELPQLWNVILGEMSLVGPRPHAIGMIAGGREASKLVETYAHRHRMKPGLTGWAAVNGSRGPADSADAIRRRVELDLEYVERQSVWFDILIILRTLPCVLGDSAVVR